MTALAVVTRPTDGVRDDRDLVAGVRSGDDRAFELLFTRYQPRITAYVRGMVRDHGRAEDITQEVFLSALRRMREETEREIHFKPWIYEIAKNKCIDAFRRGRNASEVSFDARDAIGAVELGRLAEPGATPDSTVEGKVAIDNLCGAFGSLSPVHHDILVLRELDGLSYREIGDRLGMSRPAVESTLFRARKRLAEEYEELVSGERCRRVQWIVDASREGGRAAGLRDRRRMGRHLAHCQSCRRYAGRAGFDLGAVSRPAAAVARIAGLLPLPAFLRRRWGVEEPGPLLGGQGGAVSQWSANVAAVVDPGIVSTWTKAVATAASVAVAGMGAGAAFTERPSGALLLPSSPFAQAPGNAFSAAERAAGAKAAARMAGPTTGGARPAGATSAGRVRPLRVQAAGAKPRPAAAPVAVASRPLTGPGRATGPSSADPAAPSGTGSSGADRRSPLPEPGPAVGQALGGLAGAGDSAGGAGASVAPTAPSGLVEGTTAPVTGATGAVDEAAQPTAGAVVKGPSAVTAAAGSVSSMVPNASASTTPAPSDLAG